jgi:hypothetical protein
MKKKASVKAAENRKKHGAGRAEEMILTDLAFEANKGVDNAPMPPDPSIFDCDKRSVTLAKSLSK